MIAPKSATITLKTLSTMPIRCDSFSLDGTLVSSYEGVYEVATGRKIMPVNDKQTVIDFSPDSRLLAIPDKRVFDARTGQERYSISKTAQFSPDGKLIASNGSLLEAPTGAHLAYGNVVFVPGKPYFAVNTGTGNDMSCRIEQIAP